MERASASTQRKSVKQTAREVSQKAKQNKKGQISPTETGDHSKFKGRPKLTQEGASPITKETQSKHEREPTQYAKGGKAIHNRRPA